MKTRMSLVHIVIVLMTSNTVYATGWDKNPDRSETGGRPVGCPIPVTAELEVHATYIDDDQLMCAVEIESYSWWDLLSDKSTWKNDFWFPCNSAGALINRGSKVSGTISWRYDMTCHRCNPGRNHTCTADFKLVSE